MNPMRGVFVEKVVVHMGVGEAGDKLTRAVDLLKTITGNVPIKSNAKRTNVSFGIRKGAPISCHVTLRGRKAAEFLNKALDYHGPAHSQEPARYVGELRRSG